MPHMDEDDDLRLANSLYDQAVDLVAAALHTDRDQLVISAESLSLLDSETFRAVSAKIQAATFIRDEYWEKQNGQQRKPR